MNVTALEEKLMQAARHRPPADTVPYAFAQRIMARLQAIPRMDPLAFWTRMLWRAAVSSLAVMLVVSTWIVVSPTPTASLSDDLEMAVFAGLNEIDDSQ
jgi:hypothetical protein